MNKIIYVPSSKFSGLIKRNLYVDSDVEIIENFCKYNKEIYEKILEKYHEEQDVYTHNIGIIENKFSNEIKEINKINNNLTNTQKYEELQKIPEIKEYIETLEHETVEYNEQEILEHKLQKICISDKNQSKLEEFKKENTINENLVNNYVQDIKVPDIEQLQKINPTIQKQITMLRGCIQETNAIRQLKKYFKKYNIKTDTSHICRNAKINELTLKIGGRVDAYLYEDDKKIGVIEIKTRKKNFFGIDKIKELKYDIDQLSCYWFITKLKIFYICEYYDNEIKLYKFTEDDMINNWKKLQPDLKLFCETILEIMSYTNMKKMFKNISNYLEQQNYE